MRYLDGWEGGAPASSPDKAVARRGAGVGTAVKAASGAER